GDMGPTGLFTAMLNGAVGLCDGLKLPRSALAMHEDGRVSFLAMSSSPLTIGLFQFHNGQIAKLVANQDPSPSGGQFSAIFDPVINSAGDIAFSGSQNIPGHPGTDFAWFRGQPGQWE